VGQLVPLPSGDDRVRAINHEIIPRLVKQGWKINAWFVEKIWRGERDESVVMDGLDAASGLALQAIVKHAKNFDRALGEPTTVGRCTLTPPDP
jgi:hypothetical protein